MSLVTGPSGLPNPYDITAGQPGQYPDSDQSLLYPPVNPQSTQRIAQMARLRLRDLPRPFMARQICSGVAWRFELPVENIDRDSLGGPHRHHRSGHHPPAAGPGLRPGRPWRHPHLQHAPTQGLLMVAQGTYYRDLLPAEIDLYVRTAYVQHTYGMEPTGEH